MKTLLTTILASLAILVTSSVSADCCGDGFNFNLFGIFGSGCSSCCKTCDCADPNCGRNPCLSCADCCEAFGNIGAR